jgi:hypothetical protein
MRMQRRPRRAQPAAPPAQLELARDAASLLTRAATLTGPIFAARGQTIILEPTAGDAYAAERPCRIVALFACALQEMSSLVLRNRSIACSVQGDTVVFRGENPIIMSDSVLAVDWLLLGCAKALNVVPTLDWEQGRGPRLTLMLPKCVGITASRSIASTAR